MDIHSMSDEQFQKRLLNIFKKEALGHINAMFDGIIEIEQKGIDADHTNIIDRLFRSAHSLKGSSRTVNILSIEGICQEIEEIFHDIKKGKFIISERFLNTLNDAIKVIEMIVNNPTERVDYEDIVSRLKAIRQGGIQ
ncbi:MAG: Hpt domain-containing protein, partial [Thermodesulfovibrionales bacterium]